MSGPAGTLCVVGGGAAGMMAAIQAARAAGVEPYEREVRVKTSFYKPQ